ncbi:NERD domain-containing protein [Kistimonas scapharcae]|uniref:NERD domain-containing protein n=2 Tax=Kistimonas scapharcae TaxID=1036133 RepID=A0ABP8V299_9GAMM
MDITPMITSIVTVLGYFLPLILLITVAKSAWFKGWLGERLISFTLQLLLDRKQYHLINNVTLPTDDGSTQIDHILVSRFGIFVIETKNMKGWIFGSANQKQWTQKIFRHTSRFQNPLHQNYKHTRTLANCLGLADDNLFSVVVFVGEATFKTSMPDNVTYGRGLVRYIRSKTDALLSDQEVAVAVANIQAGRLKPSLHTNREHVRHVEAIKRQKSDAKHCPACGNDMVLRTAKKGAHAGTAFWGCSTFPKCRKRIKQAA